MKFVLSLDKDCKKHEKTRKDYLKILCDFPFFIQLKLKKCVKNANNYMQKAEIFQSPPFKMHFIRSQDPQRQ